jgi:hypothetical protein
MGAVIRTKTEELALIALGELWHKNPIVDDVATLCDDCGNRFAGSESERLGRDWLRRRFADYGLDGVHRAMIETGVCA